jgi:phage tail protein X
MALKACNAMIGNEDIMYVDDGLADGGPPLDDAVRIGAPDGGNETDGGYEVLLY